MELPVEKAVVHRIIEHIPQVCLVLVGFLLGGLGGFLRSRRDRQLAEAKTEALFEHSRRRVTAGMPPLTIDEIYEAHKKE